MNRILQINLVTCCLAFVAKALFISVVFLTHHQIVKIVSYTPLRGWAPPPPYLASVCNSLAEANFWL